MPSVTEKLDNLNNLLSEFEKVNNIVEPEPDTSVKEYLSLTRDQIRATPTQDLSEIIFVLSKYAFRLQKMYNEQLSISKWAESNLIIAQSQEVQNVRQDFQTYQERMGLAIRNNEHLGKLYKLKEESSVKATRLFGLSEKVQFIVGAIRDVKYSRREDKNDG